LFLNIELEYASLKNRRISSSAKKLFVSTLILQDIKDRDHYFPLYKDEDLGVNEYWQSHLIESVSSLNNLRKPMRIIIQMLSSSSWPVYIQPVRLGRL
jgi:hypothetical protein